MPHLKPMLCIPGSAGVITGGESGVKLCVCDRSGWLGMQFVHGRLPVALDRVWQCADCQIDVALNDFGLSFGGVAEDVVGYLRFVAGVTYTDAKAIEITTIAHRTDNVADTVVTSVTAAVFVTGDAHFEIDFIISHQHVFWSNVEIAAECGYGLPAAIHKSGGK